MNQCQIRFFVLFPKSPCFRRSARCVRRFSRLNRQNLPLMHYEAAISAYPHSGYSEILSNLFILNIGGESLAAPIDATGSAPPTERCRFN
jgi:hypothetical protein